MKGISLNLHIKTKYILLLLMLMPIFQPKIFTQFAIPTLLYIIMNVCDFILLMKDRIEQGGLKVNKIIAIWIALRGHLLLMMIVNNSMENILQWGYQSLMVINLLLIFEHSKYSKLDIAMTISILGTILLAINFYTLLAFPRGIIRSSFYDVTDNDWYFLGIKTQFTTMMLPTISAAFYCFYSRKQKKQYCLLVCAIAVCLANIMKKNISTAWMGMGLLLLLMLISKLTKIKFSYLPAICISLIVCILVIFVNIQQFFSFIIVDLLGKDLTLSNRVYIWNTAKDVIFNSNIWQILFGHGQVENFVMVGNSLWPPHNALLASLHNAGIVGTMGFYYFLYRLGFNRRNNTTQQCMIMIVFALLIMTITENYFVVAVSFIPFLLLRHAGDEK